MLLVGVGVSVFGCWCWRLLFVVMDVLITSLWEYRAFMLNVLYLPSQCPSLHTHPRTLLSLSMTVSITATGNDSRRSRWTPITNVIWSRPFVASKIVKAVLRYFKLVFLPCNCHFWFKCSIHRNNTVHSPPWNVSDRSATVPMTFNVPLCNTPVIYISKYWSCVP